MRIKDIRMIRKKLNITQKELSKASGVSQSAIAKIESGVMSPSYDIAEKIFKALETLENKESIKAKDILTKEVIKANVDDSIQTAASLMKKYNISQLPVFEGDHLVGLISESTIAESMGIGNLKNKKVEEIMTEAPPTINEDSPIKMIAEILKYSPIVVVYKRNKMTGVITKSDLLKTII